MPIEIAKVKPAVSLESNAGDPAYLKIRDLIYGISGIYHSAEKLCLYLSCTQEYGDLARFTLDIDGAMEQIVGTVDSAFGAKRIAAPATT